MKDTTIGRWLVPATLCTAALAPAAAAQEPAVLIEREKLYQVASTASDFKVVSGGTVADLGEAPTFEMVPGTYVGWLATGFRLDSSALSVHLDPDIRWARTQANGEFDLVLRPVVEVISGGLFPDSDQLAYAGSIQVGIEDSLRPTETIELDQPVHLLFVADGGVAEPTNHVFTHTNQPFKTVALSTAINADTLGLRIRPNFSTQQVRLPVPVFRGALEIDVPPEVQGWGFDAARVVVRARDPLSDSATITLTTSKGVVIGDRWVLPPGGAVTARIRSSGTGSAEVVASSAMLVSATATTTFLTPWVAFLALLFGGVVGGVLGAWSRTGDEKVKPVAAGIGFGLLGVVVSGLLGLGINLLASRGFEPPPWMLDGTFTEASAGLAAAAPGAIVALTRKLRSDGGGEGGGGTASAGADAGADPPSTEP